MANVDAPLGLRLEDPHSATIVYEENAMLIFSIVRWFMPDKQASEATIQIAQKMVASVPLSGYKKYSKLVCLRLVHEQLRAQTKIKVPNDLSLDDAFCLLLRERFELSCFELGAIVNISEGSIRTRLERARSRAFNSASLRASVSELERKSLPSPSHLCIRSRELIEDWNLAQSRLGQFTAPASVVRAVGDCPKCEIVLQQRLSAISYFKELPDYSLPAELQKFPVTPLMVKQGKKLVLNWAAAPWYLKALFEGVLATTLVLGIVLSIPRVKGLYEFWLERRFDLYSVAELAAGLSSHNEVAPAPASAPALNLGSPEKPETTGAVSADKLTIKPETEFIGRDSEVPSIDKVARVLIKTDSPEAAKDHVMKALSATSSKSADDESSAGAELPGGVIFDVFVPLKHYKQLINELARLGETKVIITHAKEPGESGKAHIKIWLQRI